MGKNLILQRRGRGTPTYRAHSHRWVAEVKHRSYDDIEKTGVINGHVVDILHCAGHSAPLAQIQYDNKEIGYILAPQGIKVGDMVSSGAKAEPKPGNTLPLQHIPEGTVVFNLENMPADGGELVRAAGTSATILSSTKEGITVLLPSKKEKALNPMCRATVGIISGSGRHEKPFVKAGKKHHLMRARGKLYPRTSGVAMNAVDHPFGSGRGRHVGKPKTVSRHTPPGAKVGKVGSRRTGRKK